MLFWPFKPKFQKCMVSRLPVTPANARVIMTGKPNLPAPLFKSFKKWAASIRVLSISWLRRGGSISARLRILQLTGVSLQALSFRFNSGETRAHFCISIWNFFDLVGVSLLWVCLKAVLLPSLI